MMGRTREVMALVSDSFKGNVGHIENCRALPSPPGDRGSGVQLSSAAWMFSPLTFLPHLLADKQTWLFL
jgi:hypothetical protein